MKKEKTFRKRKCLLLAKKSPPLFNDSRIDLNQCDDGLKLRRDDIKLKNE